MTIVPTGKFIKTKEVQNGDILEFSSEGRAVVSQTLKDNNGKPKEGYELDVKTQYGETKVLNLNVTSRRLCSAAWGQDDAKWIGKQIKAFEGVTPNGEKMIIWKPVA
jgi:hypothetical protein